MKFKFFLIPYFVPDNYSPEAIALAEGLIELGHDVTANINYWYQPEDKSYLFKENNEESYDIGIYDYKYLYHSKKWTLNRVNKTKINILLDRNDWLIPEWKTNKVLNTFDHILADHLLDNVSYPKNIVPWSIGYTNRIAKYIDKFMIKEKPLAKEIACNFRVEHNLRGVLLNKFKNIKNASYPIITKITDSASFSQNGIDNSYWQQTAHRHNPEYYEIISKSLLTLAFGGYYEYKPFFYQPYNLVKKIARKPFYIGYKFLEKFNCDPSIACFIFQYDSFRMWETFYSATCPIHLNMDYWKFKLPVKPIEGIHYLGIKGFDVEELNKKLKQYSVEDIVKMGLKGKNWVKKNYSPNAVALRMLKLINK